MKRLICVLLCLMMVLASAGSLAAVNYTLPEKMQKQLEIGSGLKGSLILRGEGTSPFILALEPLLDAELQFRGMKSGDDGHYYLYQAGEGETQIGLTELYTQRSGMYFRSDFLPGEVFMIPGIENTLDKLFRPEGGNPSLASALLRWLQLGDQQSELLDPVVEKLSSQMELWVAQYSAISDVRTTESGQSVIDLTYTIPMSEVRKEIVSLLLQMLSDSDGQALLKAILDSEQQQIFANANLDYFYAAAMEAQEDDFDVQYTRTVSTLGTQLASTMELPLDEKQFHYQSLTIEENGSLVTLTLTGEERIVTFLIGEGIDLKEVDSFTCWLITRPNPAAENPENADRHALRIQVGKESIISTDEETRDHERTNWKIDVTRDVSRLPEGENAADFPEEEPLSLELGLHFYSKYSQNSPTTLEIAGSLKMKDFSLSMEGQMKTASPWVFTPFDIGENPTDLTEMTPEQREIKLAELLAAAGEQLTKSETEEETPEAAVENAENKPVEEIPLAAAEEEANEPAENLETEAPAEEATRTDETEASESETATDAPETTAPAEEKNGEATEDAKTEEAASETDQKADTDEEAAPTAPVIETKTTNQ